MKSVKNIFASGSKHIFNAIFAFVVLVALTAVLIFASASGKFDREVSTPDTSFEPSEVSEGEISRPTVLPEESEESEESIPLSEYLNKFTQVQSVPEEETVTGEALNDNMNIYLLKLPEEIYAASANTEVKAGFICADLQNGERKIYDNRLRDVTELLAEYNITHERDKKGNAVLEKEGKYYIYSDSKVVPSKFSLRDDSRGMDFYYPPYLGKQDEEIVRFRRGKGYGYRFNGGGIIVSPVFTEAFAFGENDVGAVLLSERNGGTFTFYNRRSGTVADRYYPPADRGEDCMGYFYFCDGLVRVRKAVGEKDGEKIFKESLMRSDGSLMTLPADMEIKAYSDGMILLEKNGKFGFMNSKGRWIFAPDFIKARPFFEGVSVVTDPLQKQGAVNAKGEYILPCVFDRITDFSDGIALAMSKTEGNYAIIKTEKLPE